MIIRKLSTDIAENLKLIFRYDHFERFFGDFCRFFDWCKKQEFFPDILEAPR
ncbi:MAG: hypothetical protein K9W44_15390 [Candidatus Lokiarchaeota archaeon]|nr:hypothetical protein [Candidatus Harpocratesius repetitus]